MANLGKVVITPKGTWNNSANYVKLDCVLYNGSTWLALQSSTGVTPVEGSYWTLMAQGITASELNEKLDTTGDSKDNIITFEESENDTDITSGDTHATLFGKLSKRLHVIKDTLLSKLNIGDDYRTNILINSDFSVNQRELTTYNAYGYTVDRWRFGGALITGQSVEKTSSGIKITASGTEAYIEQYIEEADKYINKTLTLSVCDSSDNIYHVTGVLDTSGTGVVIEIKPNGVEIGSVYFDYATWFVGFFRVVIMANPGKTLTIKWVKLEQNDHATPFIPRSVGEELALCQRYYRRFGTGLRIRSGLYDASAIYFTLPLGIKMRTTPTVIASSAEDVVVRMINTGITQYGFVLNIGPLNTNNPEQMGLSAIKEAHGLTDAILSIVNNGYIELDAEI